MPETVREIVNRVFREHRRYTGDGLPGEPTSAPLPIGDPQSGQHNPPKREFRDGLGQVGDDIEAARDATFDARDAAAASAVLSDARADDAASFAGFRDFKDVSTLLANESLAYGSDASQVAAGDIIRTRAEGSSYEVAASAATDHHVATAGGVKLYLRLSPASSLPDAPSLDPASWSGSASTILRPFSSRSINRVIAKQVFGLADGRQALLATTRHFDGATSTWGTSLFFPNGDDWTQLRESVANPIFNQIEYAWQGDRAMGEAIVWDHQTGKWALLFSAGGETALASAPYNSAGIRAIGLARSTQLKNGSWEINEDPIILVEDADILTWFGSSAVRVYCSGAPYWNGEQWLMPISVGVTGNYKAGIVRASTLDGPWTSAPGVNPILDPDGGAFEGNVIIPHSWHLTKDGWRMPFRGQNNGIGIASNGFDPEAPWTKSDELITPPFGADRTVLAPSESGWMIITSEVSLGTGGMVLWQENSDGLVVGSSALNAPFIAPFGYVPGSFYFSQFGIIGAETWPLEADRHYAVPIIVTRPARITGMGVEVTSSASGNVVFGLYSVRQDGSPGALIFQTSPVSTVTTGNKEAAADSIVEPGCYWMTALFSAGVTVRALSQSNTVMNAVRGAFSATPSSAAGLQALSANIAYSATLPTNFGTSVTGRSIDNVPRLYFKAGAFPV